MKELMSIILTLNVTCISESYIEIKNFISAFRENYNAQQVMLRLERKGENLNKNFI